MITLCDKSAGYFAIMLLITTAIVTSHYMVTYNEYRIMKKQSKPKDYKFKVFKLWLPFIGLTLLLIALCFLPFFLVERPIYF